MPLRRRRHPLIHLAVRSTLRLARGVQHWCFAPVKDTILGQLNNPERLRIAAVAIAPMLLESVAGNATDIFRNPWVASAVTGALLALASRAHRLHDGQ